MSTDKIDNALYNYAVCYSYIIGFAGSDEKVAYLKEIVLMKLLTIRRLNH